MLGVIPARGGSKGVPRKNIKLLGGKPLIWYTLKSAKESKFLSECLVSTEDKEIKETAIGLGAEVPFLRPKELALDTTSTLPVLTHALSEMEHQGKYFDAVCILQPTSPFRSSGFIDKCIEKFIQTKADTLISVKKVPDHYNPHWTFEKDENGIARIATGESQIIPRRQLLPDTFYRDGMVYLVKRELLMTGDTLYGEKVVCLESQGENMNIDNMDDWEKAEKYISK
ncbi:acylneuraminate cytidylyltransferase family protein [Akkermansiaceae bacterium]|nr:acylneuraminate cytidylyltransferase family protein [Akkermansiaceae bacterium]